MERTRGEENARSVSLVTLEFAAEALSPLTVRLSPLAAFSFSFSTPAARPEYMTFSSRPILSISIRLRFQTSCQPRRGYALLSFTPFVSAATGVLDTSGPALCRACDFCDFCAALCDSLLTSEAASALLLALLEKLRSPGVAGRIGLYRLVGPATALLS
jgi:hypothetical protein